MIQMDVEIINPLTFVVLNEFKEQFDDVYFFIYDNSDTSTQMNISTNWKVEYVKEYDQELIDQISIQDYDDLKLVFSSFVKRRIQDFLEMKFKLDDEGDIIVDFPFTFAWKYFMPEIEKRIKGFTSDHFLENSAFQVVDAVYYNHAIESVYYYFNELHSNRVIISCVNMKDAIIKTAQEYVEYNTSKFTERQIEVLIKKIMGITLDSAERDVLSRVRERIRKAKDIIDEIKTEEYLFRV